MDAVWCTWIPDDGWPCRACVGTELAPGDQIPVQGFGLNNQGRFRLTALLTLLIR